MGDYEELESKIRSLERKVDDLDYDLRAAKRDLEAEIRQKGVKGEDLMCDCIAKLVEKGFVEHESVYENQDFVQKGYLIRKYNKTKEGIVDIKHIFKVNYCPACGGKL